jgi:hypothetical protein
MLFLLSLTTNFALRNELSIPNNVLLLIKPNPPQTAVVSILAVCGGFPLATSFQTDEQS